MRAIEVWWAGEGRANFKGAAFYKGAAMTGLQRIVPQGIGPSNGSLFIYSAPRVVTRHIEWTIANLLGAPVSMNWNVQSLQPSSMWSSLNWRGKYGVASQMASELAGWHYLRFELHEAPSNGVDGSLFMFVPELGIYRGSVNSHGDLMLNENQVTSCIRSNQRHHDVITELERALGKPWDDELECYRRAIAEDGSVESTRLSV